MSQWNTFKFDSPRFDREEDVSEASRKLLEYEVAAKLAALLSKYGEIVTEEVDVCGSPTIEELKTFDILQLDPLELADDSLLFIGQAPATAKGYTTDPGIHAFELDDEAGELTLSLQVYDPEHPDGPVVKGFSGEEVPLTILAEVRDALIAVKAGYDFNHPQNDPLINTATYPKAQSSDIFDSIIEGNAW